MVHVRPAILEDVPAILAIRAIRRAAWLAAYPSEAHGISVQDLEALLLTGAKSHGAWARRVETPSPGHRTWVAERDDAVRGFLYAHDANGPWINSFYVDPPAWRRGIGRALISAAFEHFGPGASIGLRVVAYNERAIAFYRVMGFVPSAEPSEPVEPTPPGKVMPTIRMNRFGVP